MSAVLWMQQINLYACKSPVEKKGWHGHSLSERGRQRARGPQSLLLLFWVHYIEDGPHLLCKACCRRLPFIENKGENVANYIKEGSHSLYLGLL